ncbi:hypothetical protein HHK36_030443 [Tetracentron sinense]|uniref:Uncharacterized protein n=1 Tax=Tetracentron sinense TaxID=13715 RepID=A0A834YCI3_TETSI|nr:hypothetical protein HHK36_030443 [Tetracentron sinense]
MLFHKKLRSCVDILQLAALFAHGDEERMDSWAMEMPKTDIFQHRQVHWMAIKLYPLLVELIIQLHILNLRCKCIVGDGVFLVYESSSLGDFGRLGHGNSNDLFTPQPIKALQGVRIKQIACGDSHCLAVTMEGEVQRLVDFSVHTSSLVLGRLDY